MMTRMSDRLKIIIVEDVPFDAELMERELRKSGFEFTTRCVETEQDFLRELKQFSPDLILSDNSMPRFNGMKALQLSKQHAPLTPFILVTGSVNEMTAVECIKAGADDYVLKEHLTRLAPAVNDAFKRSRNAREKEKVERALRESEDMFRMITENMSDLIAVVDLDGRRVYNSPSYRDMFGDPDLLRGTDSFDDIHPDDRERVRHVFRETIHTGEGQRAEYRFLLKDGSIRRIESIGAVVKGENGKPTRVVVVSRDVTERKHAEVERENLIATLQAALSEVKLLSGLLPICAWCKKIRDDNGYYHQLEEYISSHSEAEFTHGICPTCAAKHFSNSMGDSA